jgi:hypothetical protein
VLQRLSVYEDRPAPRPHAILGFGLDDGDGQVLRAKRERRGHADGSGSHDENAVGHFHLT